MRNIESYAVSVATATLVSSLALQGCGAKPDLAHGPLPAQPAPYACNTYYIAGDTASVLLKHTDTESRVLPDAIEVQNKTSLQTYERPITHHGRLEDDAQFVGIQNFSTKTFLVRAVKHGHKILCR